jgi:modification target Cys-rich repeat protein
MRIHSRLITAVAVVALAALGGCPKNLPGGGGLPDKGGLPGGGNVPGGLAGASGEVDPNSCGNYALMDGGNKLKAFLQATKDLEKTTEETVHVVKNSCEMIGRELGMTDADFKGEAKDVCAHVYGALRDNMKVSFKAQASLKIKYKPAVCRVNVDAEAKAAAECEGKASADVGATCTGACHGKCDGTCSGKAGTGGSGAECNGECKGTCHGECEGHADVKASAQCRASASVKASIDVKCTEPELTVEAEAKGILDKSKAEMVIRALKNGLPKALSVKAHLEPLKGAVEVWAQSAKELKEMGPKFINSFKDQALCISGQLAAAVGMIGKINTNISVSVDVSVSASATSSGSAGG